VPALRRRPDVPAPAFTMRYPSLVWVAAIALGGWLVSTSPWTEVRLAVVFVAVGVVMYWVLSSRPSLEGETT
jgi:hypothetical protein